MDILNTLLVAKPNSLWSKIIMGIDSKIGAYIWTIIIVTVLIKLCLLPFEYFQRRSTKKMTDVNTKLQPKMDAIKKQYANNPNMMNQKMAELQKREGAGMYGGCIGMLLYLVLSMVVFFTFCGSMNEMSKYMIAKQYTDLSNTYDTHYAQNIADGQTEEDAIQNAQLAVLDAYEDTQNSFLWIKNIWRPDNNGSPVLSYKEYQNSAKDKTVTEERYNLVMEEVNAEYKKTWNGYYILPILSAVLSYLSTKVSVWVSRARAKKKGLIYNNPANNGLMNIMMPIIMALFTLMYNAAFAIYVVASSIVGLITSPLLTLLVEYLEEKRQARQNQKPIISYSRDNLKK